MNNHADRKEKNKSPTHTPHLVELLPRPHARAAVLLLAGLADGVEGSHHVQQIVRVHGVTANQIRSSSHHSVIRSSDHDVIIPWDPSIG